MVSGFKEIIMKKDMWGIIVWATYEGMKMTFLEKPIIVEVV